MARSNYFDHIGLDGSTPASRARRAGYTSDQVGENIGAGYASAEAAPRIGAVLQRELGLSEDVVAAQVAAYVASTSKEKAILMGEQA